MTTSNGCGRHRLSRAAQTMALSHYVQVIEFDRLIVTIANNEQLQKVESLSDSLSDHDHDIVIMSDCVIE